MGSDLPRRAAQGFADQLNSVLNRTISDSRLSLIQRPGDSGAFQITRLVAWHLIAEWDVETKSDNWQAILAASIEGFDSRRTVG
jgi:hypothetical protein